ncbi:glycosyltransferase family 4 protein [Ferruginibacter sp. SUN002]|uniref:glycosyltransferase family 4 protein n=1 Tax=Ferruginibacter sp. SUN002 TaxID=2937789 RepID=UPI003D3685E8
MPYSIAVILPHTKLFGGVRRFFELGKIFIANGHTMTILTPDGIAPDWFDFAGTIDKVSNIQQYKFDLLFTTEPVFLNDLLKADSRLKVFYHVGPSARLDDILKHKEIIVFSNSTNMYLHNKRTYNIETVKALGGVHIPATAKEITNKRPFVIMCYGRLSRKGKGTNIVVKAAEKLYRSGQDVKLILFDTPLDEKGKEQIKSFTCAAPFEFVLNHPVDENEQLFKKADVFVAVERKGGWSNTAAEALAAGVPLVASNTGTNDFLIDGVTGIKVWRHSFFVKRAIEKLMNDIELQKLLATNGREKMKTLSWDTLAKFILQFIKEKSSI